jgi:translation initiation factor IF-2
MGHIDHGKTSLLDKIRSTNTWAREAGGITQHVSAYQVAINPKNSTPKLITFIDTPGHAAFCNMRARGAQATDIVILVVAATEGIMAQTKECIDHIKKSNLPFIVAMNKMDLPGANPDKLKGQLVDLGFTPEEYGGQVALIPVSAKTGEGIDKLLEMVLLNAEILELESCPQDPLEAFVIESRVDKNRGPVAQVVVKQGTLRVGDVVYADLAQAKVKALIDFTGKNISQALPGTPVEILGFDRAPAVGSLVTPQKHDLTQVAQSVRHIAAADPDHPKYSVVIKADTEGTLEALLTSISDDVQVIYAGVGPISDNDIFLASAAKATIYAFGVPTPSHIGKLADNQKVKIISSKIIYEILEDIEAKVLKMLEPTIDEEILGEAIIKAEFKIDKVRIAGTSITKGVFSKGDSIHLKRDGKIIKDTKVENIRTAKLDVDTIKMGNECGMTFRPYVDFKINDVIISYNKKE